jgi:hypothetical protein
MPAGTPGVTAWSSTMLTATYEGAAGAIQLLADRTSS